jgi:hypothetical protein
MNRFSSIVLWALCSLMCLSDAKAFPTGGVNMPPTGDGPTKVVNVPHELIWSGQSGGGSIEYWRDGILTGLAGKSYYSYRPGDSASNYASEEQVNLLAVVGAYYSIFSDSIWIGEGGYDLGRRIDVRTIKFGDSPISVLDLRNLYSPAQLFKAFKKNKRIRSYLTLLQSSPQDLEGLLEALKRLQTLSPEDLGGNDPQCMIVWTGETWLRPFLTRFAFKAVSKKRVTVEMAFDVTNTALCPKLASFNLSLPIPSSLRVALTLAADRNKGFLMKDVKKVVGKEVISYKRYFLNALPE